MEGAGGRAMRLPPISPANSAAPDDDGGPGGGPEIDRERLLNDIANTGVMGALIGGFALSNVQMEYDMAVGLEVAIYLCSFVTVHACTCSAVTAALLFRVANALPDSRAPRWAAQNAVLLKLPMMKFGVGCLFYLLSVVHNLTNARYPARTYSHSLIAYRMFG